MPVGERMATALRLRRTRSLRSSGLVHKLADPRNWLSVLVLGVASVVAAVAVALYPIIAVAIPAVAVSAWLFNRHPAVGALVVVVISGAYGSLIAFIAFPITKTIHLVLAGLWLAAIWAYLLKGRERPIWLWPGVLALAGYLFVTVSELLAAGSVATALPSFAESGWYMLAFLLVGYAGWRARAYAAVSRGVLVVAALVGAYATLRWITGPAPAEEAVAASTPFNFVGDELKVVGSFPTGQDLGGWTAAVTPFCVALALALRGGWRVLAVAAGSLCMIALVGSQLRIALAAVMGSVALVVLLYGFARSFPGVKAARSLPIVLAVLAIGGGAFALTGGSSDPVNHSYASLFKPSRSDQSVDDRLYKWEQALNDLEGKPFGYGIGTASFIGQRSGRFYLNIGARNIDNGYLKIALEQGFVVMVLFTAGLALLVVGLSRRAIFAVDREQAGVAIGAAGTLLSFMILMLAAAFTDGPRSLIVWIIVGLGVAQFAFRRSNADDPATVSGPHGASPRGGVGR